MLNDLEKGLISFDFEVILVMWPWHVFIRFTHTVVLDLSLFVYFRSLSVGHSESRRVTDELGSRLERPIHFECN